MFLKFRPSILTAPAAVWAVAWAMNPGAAWADNGRRNLFAVVDATGNLVSGNGASGASQLGTGQYEVTFDRDVSRCAYVAKPPTRTARRSPSLRPAAT